MSENLLRGKALIDEAAKWARGPKGCGYAIVLADELARLTADLARVTGELADLKLNQTACHESHARDVRMLAACRDAANAERARAKGMEEALRETKQALDALWNHAWMSVLPNTSLDVMVRNARALSPSPAKPRGCPRCGFSLDVCQCYSPPAKED